jgi:hypothetical protein
VSYKIDNPYFVGRAKYNLAFFCLNRGEGVDAALPYAQAAFSKFGPILEPGHEMRKAYGMFLVYIDFCTPGTLPIKGGR